MDKVAFETMVMECLQFSVRSFLLAVEKLGLREDMIQECYRNNDVYLVG